MNGVDYTKTRSRDQEYLKDTISKNNKANEKKLSDLTERSEKAEAKLRESHMQDRAELESKYQNNLNQLSKKTAESIDKKGNNYQKDLEDQRQKFEEDSQIAKKDFDQRLNDIKSSYNKSIKSEKGLHDDLQESQKQRYSKNIAELSDSQEKQLGEYNNRLQDAGSGIKDQYNRERQQLVRAQEDQVAGIYKDERKKQLDIQRRTGRELQVSKEAQDAEQKQMRQYMDEKVSNLEDKHNDRNSALAHEYSQKNSELSENQKRVALKTNREHQDQVADLTRKFNKELRETHNEARKNNNGNDLAPEVSAKQRGLSGEALMRNQIRKLNNNLANEKNLHHAKMAEQQEDFGNDMKARDDDYAAGVQKAANAATADKRMAITHEREKAQFKVDSLQKQNAVDKEEFARNVSLEQTSSRDKLENLRINFNKSISALEEKLMITKDELGRANKEDKAEFMKKTSEKHIADLRDIKREFAKSMDATVESYESQIANLKRENDKLRMTMDQKVNDIVHYADKKLESQQKLFTDMKAAEQNEIQIAMDQRENQIKADKNVLVNNFKKKLDKIQIDNESKIKLLTNEYETKLSELAAKNSKEMAMKDSSSKLEKDALKKGFEAEKANLISTFQAQIADLKLTQENQLQSMKEYKKLS